MNIKLEAQYQGWKTNIYDHASRKSLEHPYGHGQRQVEQYEQSFPQRGLNPLPNILGVEINQHPTRRT